MVAGDNPAAFGPSSGSSACGIAEVEIPLR
jgi:hypothetical protein